LGIFILFCLDNGRAQSNQGDQVGLQKTMTSSSLLAASNFKFKTAIARQNSPVETPKKQSSSASRFHLANFPLPIKNKKCMRYALLPICGNSNI
jgi:hypothetical protein